MREARSSRSAPLARVSGRTAWPARMKAPAIGPPCEPVAPWTAMVLVMPDLIVPNRYWYPGRDAVSSTEPMDEPDCAPTAGCPVERALRVLDGKWTVLIIRDLLERAEALHGAAHVAADRQPEDAHRAPAHPRAPGHPHPHTPPTRRCRRGWSTSSPCAATASACARGDGRLGRPRPRHGCLSLRLSEPSPAVAAHAEPDVQAAGSVPVADGDVAGRRLRLDDALGRGIGAHVDVLFAAAGVGLDGVGARVAGSAMSTSPDAVAAVT